MVLPLVSVLQMPNCGDCTACCNVLLIEDINKQAYTPCQHCDGGCAIYDTKPQTCNEFECAYLQAKDVPELLRPDKCGIIFIKRTDSIFSGLILPDVEVSDAAKGQVNAFNAQGFSVVLKKQNANKPHIMLSEGHNADEIYSEYKEQLVGNL